MPATSEDVHGRDRPGYDELLKAGPISRHRRACSGDLDQEGKAVPLESGWPGQTRP